MPPKLELPRNVCLVPLGNAQPYAQNYSSAHVPIPAEQLAKQAYLVVDETGDTSSNLVSEVQEDMLMNGHTFEDTRMGKVVNLAFTHRWFTCVWWADEKKETEIVWLQNIESFRDVLLEQLFATGNVAIGYLPETKV